MSSVRRQPWRWAPSTRPWPTPPGFFENAVSAQQQQNALALAASNMGVMQIYSLDTAADAGATEKVGQLGGADNLTSLLTVLKSFT